MGFQDPTAEPSVPDQPANGHFDPTNLDMGNWQHSTDSPRHPDVGQARSDRATQMEAWWLGFYEDPNYRPPDDSDLPPAS